MNDRPSFREMIVALRAESTKDLIEATQSQDFWFVIDRLTDEDLLKWGNRAASIESPYNGPWVPSEWLQLCNILTYMKHRDPMTELPWSKKQRRFCAMMIIKYWDELEMMYFC